MESDKAREELTRAIEHLQRHSDHETCPWCKSKGKAIMDLAQELLEASPVAHQLSEKVDTLRHDRIAELSDSMKIGGEETPSDPVRPQPRRVWRGRPAPPRLYGRRRGERGILRRKS